MIHFDPSFSLAIQIRPNSEIQFGEYTQLELIRLPKRRAEEFLNVICQNLIQIQRPEVTLHISLKLEDIRHF